MRSARHTGCGDGSARARPRGPGSGRVVPWAGRGRVVPWAGRGRVVAWAGRGRVLGAVVRRFDVLGVVSLHSSGVGRGPGGAGPAVRGPGGAVPRAGVRAPAGHPGEPGDGPRGAITGW